MVVTIHDVAREAGVSSATVSRIFNGRTSVGDYVARVMEAAGRLGYRPNLVARNLRRKTSDVIALIIPDVGYSFHSALARGVEDEAQKAGYSVLLCNTDENSEKEARYIDVTAMQQVAGVVLCPHDSSVDLERIISQEIPVVAIDRVLKYETDVVLSTSYAGAYDATKHLIEQGWKRPACITGPEDIKTARERAEGYSEAAREAGREPLIHYEGFDARAGARTVARLLDSDNPPDAIFTGNEALALGALTEFRRRGIRVGEGVGMATFDDSPWAVLLDPPLTVVEQMPYEIAVQATRMLVERLQSSESIEPRTVAFPTRLIVRRSSIRAD